MCISILLKTILILRIILRIKNIDYFNKIMIYYIFSVKYISTFIIKLYDISLTSSIYEQF